MACVLEWTRADWGADHVFTSCSWTSGKKGTDVLASALRVDLKYHESSLLLTGSSGGFQVSSNSCTAFDRTLMSSSWRPEGSELPSCSGSDPAQPSFSEAEMDMASSPSSWPKATNPSILEGGRKQSSWKEIGECGDRWVRRHGKTALPPPGEGGLTSGTLAAVSPTPNRPRTTSRRARSTVHSRTRPAPPRRGPGPGRRRSGDADPAVRWVPRRSYTLKPSRIQGEVEDSDIIVASIAFILSRARHICMLRDNWPVIWLAWANRTSGKVEGKEFP